RTGWWRASWSGGGTTRSGRGASWRRGNAGGGGAGSRRWPTRGKGACGGGGATWRARGGGGRPGPGGGRASWPGPLRAERRRVGEVVLLRDDAPRGAGGTNTVRVGWRSGAWTELTVRRPGAGDHGRTPAPVLARIRALAQAHPDDRVAEILNADGLRTRRGLP